MTNRSTCEKTAVPIELRTRIAEVIGKYRLEYVAGLDLPPSGECTDFDVSREGVYTGCIRRDAQGTRGEVVCRACAKAKDERALVEGIETSTSEMSVLWHRAENALLYTKVVDHSLQVVKRDITNGAEVVFDTPPWGGLINVTSIKAGGAGVLVTDMCSHAIAEDTAGGKCVRQLRIPGHCQFPVDIEPMNDGTYLVAFHQKHENSRPEHARNGVADGCYLVLMDASGQVIRDLTNMAAHLLTWARIRALAADQSGNYYVLTATHLIKAGSALKKVFEVDLSRLLKTSGGAEKHVQAGCFFYAMRYLNGRLYLMERKTDRKLYVFDV